MPAQITNLVRIGSWCLALGKWAVGRGLARGSRLFCGNLVLQPRLPRIEACSVFTLVPACTVAELLNAAL